MTVPGPDRPQPDDVTKQRWREAERAHDELKSVGEIHAKQVEAFSLMGMRSLGVTAGAGIAAVLGFYSANYARLLGNPQSLSALNGALGWFFTALLLLLACILFAYFSQVLFHEATASVVRTWEHPYREWTKKATRSRFLGNVARWVSIATAVGSAVAIITGGVAFLGLVH